MNKIDVTRLKQLKESSSMGEVSTALDQLQRHKIEQVPWPEYQFAPQAAFSIGHNNDCIFLKYWVTETVLKATYFKANDPVYKDSCVEFFVALDEENAYYNLEINAIGTIKFNFGTQRNNRKIIPEEVINRIRYASFIQNINHLNQIPEVKWELSLVIPVGVFLDHNIKSLSGLSCAANFYKCGDDLPEPHFLAWNTIKSAEPDFHRREYFGKLLFL